MPVRTELFDLTGRVALVSGGASGLGKAVAAALVRHGALVLVAGPDAAQVESAARELDALRDTTGTDPVAAGVALDGRAEAGFTHAVKKAMDVFGKLHVLVNVVGPDSPARPAFELAAGDFASLHEVDAAVRLSQAAGHVFREQHDGRVINIAGGGAAGATAGAMVGWTRALAREWGEYGIRTNAVVGSGATDAVAAAAVLLASAAGAAMNGQTIEATK